MKVAKSSLQIKREKELSAQIALDEILKKKKVKEIPIKTFKGFNGLEFLEEYFKCEQYEEKFIFKRKKKVVSKKYTRYQELKDWIIKNSLKDLSTWKAKSYNNEKNFIDLFKYGIVKYSYPKQLFNDVIEIFDDKSDLSFTWNKTFVKLFIAITQGHSLHKTLFKNVKFTKAEIVDFVKYCDKYDLDSAMLFSKLKGNKQYFEVFDEYLTIQTPYLDNTIKVNFLEGFFQFVNKNPKFPEDSIKDFKDYVVYLYNRENTKNTFSWKGRTIGSMIDLTNEWHRTEVILSKNDENAEWKGLDIPDRKYNVGQDQYWEVKQLKNGKSLANEGRKMKHCVASYFDLCMRGKSYIFSFNFFDKYNYDVSKKFTVEVNNDKVVVQAKKKLNGKIIDIFEQEILKKWIGDNGLKTSKYIF